MSGELDQTATSMRLDGRRALVTGAAGGIGRVFCETLAQMGADLILVDRPGAVSDRVVAGLRERFSNQVEVIECDLEFEAQRQDMIAQLNSGAGLSVLVNNAAFVGTSDLQGWGVPFDRQTVATWRRALEVNLTAVFHLCQGLAPVMGRSVGASIVNIASIYGEFGPDWRLYEGTTMANPAAYGASKGGVIQLTRWLATTLAPTIRVNAISPGGVFRQQPAEFVERYIGRVPLGRMASEKDMCGPLAFLVSDMSAYVTGQNLMVDGGWGVW